MIGMWALVHLIGSVVRFRAVEAKPLQPDGLEVGGFQWAREMYYQGYSLEELADGEWEESTPFKDYGNKWRIDPRSKKGPPRRRDYFKGYNLAVTRKSDA